MVLLIGAGGTMAAEPPPPQSTAAITEALQASLSLPFDWSLVQVDATADAVTVCLDLPLDALQADEGMGAELVEEAVAGVLLPFSWSSLYVRALDHDTGTCKPLPAFLPQEASLSSMGVSGPQIEPYVVRTTDFPRSLAGKTVYVSAGHGWQWNGYAWRTQRPPYQDIIEDHNNAEAVDQYLIPYLEQAGATVIPVRERDWNTSRVIADNDEAAVYAESGNWTTSVHPGYAEGTYRYAYAVNGAATAAATWTLDVPQTAEYALYAWVPPASDRIRDAHYTVHHAAGTSEVWLDQRIRQATWRYLGTFPFYAGTTTVVLDNATGFDTGGTEVVVADALRLGGGTIDDLAGIDTTAPSAPNFPWWEVATFYYSQWMGMDAPYGDVTARPIFARWNHAGVDEDALYISWHTNGYNGDNDLYWGTVSYRYLYDEDYPAYDVTEGSPALQDAIHTELINDLRAGWDPDWRDLGQRARNLGEVRLLWDEVAENRMPGVLLEIAYHDHVEDANALKDPRFNQMAARAIYQGIVAYFKMRDNADLVALPEPPTHLRVQNQGGGTVHVAWSPSPTDTDDLGGDAATGYRLYTSPDGFAWGDPLSVAGTETTLTGLVDGQTVFVKVTAVNDGGESFPTEVLGARVGADAPLLIVNGYDKLNRFGLVQEVDPIEGPNLRMFLDQINSRDYVIDHGEATPQTYAWDSASNEAVIAGSVALSGYDVVDWILGEESTEEDGTLDAAERAALSAFLSGGGALLISGTELAWDLETSAPDFLHATLRTGYVADDAGTYAVSSVAGGAFEGMSDFAFDAPGEYDADFPDILAAWSGSDASAALTYAGGSGGTAAVQFANGCERLLVLGFPFEVVRPEARGTVMAKALDFLDQCVDSRPETGITAPAVDSYHASAPAVTGWASGAAVQRVDAQLQRHSDSTFWNGSGWEGSPAWLAASGTASWSYALPALSDGGYTLQARAWASASEFDATPAVVTFTLDTLPPQAPTLITPTGGITLTGVSTYMAWGAPADVGSPLHYQLAINAMTRTVESTHYTAALGSGSYRWRVRAVDAAENAGPWTGEAAFAVEVPSVYLPLVVRAHKTTPPAPTPTPEPTPDPTPDPTPEPTPEPCEFILDDGFESETGWTYSATSPARAERVSSTVHAGSWAALAGIPSGEAGGGDTAYASLSRAVVLPADADTITLQFWAYPIAEASDPGDLHYVGLRDAENTWHGLSTETEDGWAWESRAFDLTAYAGQPITLYFGTKNDGDADTAALYLDDIQIEVCR